MSGNLCSGCFVGRDNCDLADPSDYCELIRKMAAAKQVCMVEGHQFTEDKPLCHRCGEEKL